MMERSSLLYLTGLQRYPSKCFGLSKSTWTDLDRSVKKRLDRLCKAPEKSNEDLMSGNTFGGQNICMRIIASS